MSTLKPFEILDCTIRDGGYLNQWQFDQRMVREMYRQLSKTGIDFVELGFANQSALNQTKPSSPFEHLTESFLNELTRGIKGIPIALMVDMGKFDPHLIVHRSESPVALFRVACHKDQILKAIVACNQLKDKGYLVSIQLMAIAGYTPQDFESFLSMLKD